MSEYANGTVAVATVRGVGGVRVFRVNGAWCFYKLTLPATYCAIYDCANEVTDIRPLVVLDLDDAKFLRGYTAEAVHQGSVKRLGEAIEAAQIRPPKPEVYEHIVVADHKAIGDHRPFLQALCGKKWRQSEDVTVIGRCPDCASAAWRWSA